MPLQLNAIQVCDVCGAPVIFTNNAQIYHTPHGDWPYIYLCTNADCQALVGCHLGTDRPMGLMACSATRRARREAHAAFDPLWRDGHMTRPEAYQWLAAQMQLTTDDCHIGLFGVEQCNLVIQLATARMESR